MGALKEMEADFEDEALGNFQSNQKDSAASHSLLYPYTFFPKGTWSD